jgi:hypothetical protein
VAAVSWDAITAIGSIAGAVVLLVAAIAAIVQLKHLRLANQMGSYLELMRQLSTPEMVAAREYVESCNFEDPEAVRQAFAGGLDSRILIVGSFFQTACRLINFGILDRELFAPIVMVVPGIWRALRPIAYEMRARTPGNPRWADIEYLVYRTRNSPVSPKRYSAEFRSRIDFDAQIAEWSRQARALSAPRSTPKIDEPAGD